MTTNTPAHTPPEKPTDEATRQGLQQAHIAGSTYQQTLDYFIAHVAVSGQTKRAGDYIVGVATEHAEPLYLPAGGKLVASLPADTNAHLEVAVADAGDGRFIPGLDVYVTLSQADGKDLGTFQLPFLWHPTLYHYGLNVHVPSSGEYTLRVFIDMPRFPRHDMKNGKRYEQPVTVEFTGVKIEPGRK